MFIFSFGRQAHLCGCLIHSLHRLPLPRSTITARAHPLQLIHAQHQRFLLEQGSSLVLVDWLTSGRMSRGEGWEFNRLESRNEVMVQVYACVEHT